MSEINNLFDLAEHIGFDAIDSEVEVWIDMGEFDHAVKDRAVKMNIAVGPDNQDALAAGQYGLQATHRQIHPDGPYGWEFCGVCSTLAHAAF